MDTTQPTKKQLATLIRLADGYEEHSAYLMLHDGTALAALYERGDAHYRWVGRDGKQITGRRMRIPLGVSLP